MYFGKAKRFHNQNTKKVESMNDFEILETILFVVGVTLIT